MSEETTPHIAVEERDGVVVARLLDAMIFDEEQIHAVGEELDRIVARPAARRLVLDLDKVQYLSSAAIGKFLGVRRKVVARGGQLKLCCIRPEVLETFQLTRLDSVFQMHQDEAEAVAGFVEE